MSPFELKETWEGDGTGGVMFELPSGGTVFVTRWTDRGEPTRATPQDWADARLLVDALRAHQKEAAPCSK